MEKQELLSLFTPETQEYITLKWILLFGHIYNHEFHTLGILSHTKVTSNIRKRIAPEFDLSCKVVRIPDLETGKLKATGTRINRIIKNEEIK